MGVGMDYQIQADQTTRRCPKCNAALAVDAKTCAECELLAKHPPQPKETNLRRARFGLLDRVVGLGVPLDIWALTGVCLVFLFVRMFVLGFSEGLAVGLIQIALPVAIVAFSDSIGGFTGFFRGVHVGHEAHPSFVKIVGWGMLLLTMAWSCYAMFGSPERMP